MPLGLDRIRPSDGCATDEHAATVNADERALAQFRAECRFLFRVSEASNMMFIATSCLGYYFTKKSVRRMAVGRCVKKGGIPPYRLLRCDPKKKSLLFFSKPYDLHSLEI
jgi:hypothetical protein